MVSSLNEDEPLRLGNGRNQLFQLLPGTKRIARSADEEFGSAALRKEVVVIPALIDGRNRRAQADQSPDSGICTSRPQPDSRSKRESREDYRTTKFVFQPVQRASHIIYFPVSMVMFPLAQASAAEIEAQNGKPKAMQRFHGVKHNFVVKSATVQRMRVADESRMRGILYPNVEQSFQLPGRTLEKKRPDAGAWG